MTDEKTLHAKLAEAVERRGMEANSFHVSTDTSYAGTRWEWCKLCGADMKKPGMVLARCKRNLLPIPDLLAALEGWLLCDPERATVLVMELRKFFNKTGDPFTAESAIFAMLQLTDEQLIQCMLEAERRVG